MTSKLHCFSGGLQGIGFGIGSTGASTYIVKNLDPKHLLEGVGYSSIANGITAVIGPSLGYYLIGVKYDNFTNLFMASMIMICILIGLMIIGKEPAGLEKSKANDTGESTINWKVLIVPLLILFLNCIDSKRCSLIHFPLCHFIGIRLDWPVFLV